MKVALPMQILQTVGAVDGAHIEINSLSGDSEVDYSNRKLKYTINTRAVVGGILELLIEQQIMLVVSMMLAV